MIALGCMRLSTAKDRNDAHSLEVIHAALEAGVSLFDTADAYALDDTEVGHNERLLARALAGRRAYVVTKGGLVRPGGAWVSNGRAKHLDAAARASRDRLGVEALDLYLLHAVDPGVPLATSVRALAKLRDAGVTRAIGLSNIGLHQLEQALAITKLDAIEVELNPWHLDALRSGLVAACKQRGIVVLAHRPLGGPAGVKRLGRDEVVAATAARLSATPAEIVLAWLRHLGVVPLPGATRIESVRSAARVIELPADTAAALDAHFTTVGEAPRQPATQALEREVVMIVGMPAAGKTTLAHDFAARGYLRLNRDERGGTLLDLARVLDRELAAGAARVVLDNTYGTRATRAPVVEVAKRHDVPVRCLVTTTSLEQAQSNAVARMLELHGRLLEPVELRRTAMIAPTAQFRYRRDYEPPRSDEGFASVEELTFTPRVAQAGRPALVVELDDIVWRGRPRTPDAIALVPGIRDQLAHWHEAGYVLAGTSWLTPPSLDARIAELLDLPLVIARCAHPAGPPICWCRKPLPGLALLLAHEHRLDLSRSVHVGKGAADRGFAVRAGLAYVDVADGFPTPANTAS